MNILDPNITPITELQDDDRLYVGRPGPPAQDCSIDGASLKASAGSLPIRIVTGNYTLDLVEDRGRHLKVTAEATITIPPDAPDGWSCSIGHQAVGDVVDITEGSGVTILSKDDAREIEERGAISLICDGNDEWEAYGAWVAP